MKYCIIYAHPNPLSFSHAIKQRVVEIIESRDSICEIIDLYEDNFNPVLNVDDFIALQNGEVLPEVKKYQQQVANADHLIFIYPIWWYGQPAILKGWIDRVFSWGFAYRDDENGFTPLLTDKRATLLLPLGSTKAILEQYDMLRFIDNMIVGTLNLVGISSVNYQPFYGLPALTDEQRRELLEQIVI
ncbi:NAD(P)H-dependent oxidoreductase [Jejubacter calystegiae]|uniref:NAD(P)H-dependent oxidoreductase n=1 Tax=Jejubacter calystegiae TaxID=2579935 RepID=A0A4P8YH45_9ENTR|nr:NAD(P)H-dependent oxidoreductase [Jejubacter calystegiae]QCT19989.1 NAD(P)H-dependent oxidoreductase [Jejubacter calystegiae]